MRSSSTVAAVFLFAALARAQDDPRALVERAVRAQGGEARLAKSRAGQTRVKGTLFLQADVPFTKEVLYQLPDQIKDVLTAEVEGQKLTVTTVFNGEKGWISRNGKTELLADPALLTELRESAYLVEVCRLLPLRDRAFQLTDLGEAKVEDRPAQAVQVSLRGRRDVRLFFDRDTGLLVKTERKVVPPKTRREAVEERFLGDFKVIDGLRSPTRLRVAVDGKTTVDAEVVGVRFLERLDPEQFARP